MSSAPLATSTSVDQTRSLTASLGEFVGTLSLDKVPDTVVRQAKLSILDTIGCYLAGADTLEARKVLAAEQTIGKGSEGQVFAYNTRLPLDAAMRLNGYMGDIFELNDLIGGHASIAVVTLAVTLADSIGSTGSELLRATVAGIETTSRIYSGYYSHIKPYTQTGITPPGIPSTLGSAAAAASLLNLSPLQCAAAIANAGALAGWCPAEVIFGDGGTVKPMLFGAWPASVGHLGARYAAQGITGPDRLLESDIGFYATVATAQNPHAVLSNDVWYLEQPRRKLHACCGYIHSAIDVVIELRKRMGTELVRSRSIEIGMPNYIIPAVSKAGPPTTANEARFHAEYCIALAAAGIDVIMPEHSLDFQQYLARPEISALMDAIRVVPAGDLSHYHHCRVTVTPASGAAISAEGRGPKGSPQNPMTDEEVVAKFDRLTEPRLGRERARSYTERVLKLETEQELGWLFQATH